jgi:hypothetical protein
MFSAACALVFAVMLSSEWGGVTTIMVSIYIMKSKVLQPFYHLLRIRLRIFPKLYTSANRLLSLRSLPHFHKQNMRTLHTTMQPANKLTPPSIPMPVNIGRENKMAATAKRLLERLLAEKMLAAYRG